MPKRTNAQRRKRLFLYQDGLCYWCRELMVMVDWQFYTQMKREPPPNACTLEHLDSKLCDARGNNGRYRVVGACRRCNHERGQAEERALGAEELRRRAGQPPNL